MDTPFKRALEFSFERMLDESLAAVEIDKTWLHLRDWAAQRLAKTEEIREYLKHYAPSSPGMDYITTGGITDDGLCEVLPGVLYGCKVFIPKSPSVLVMQGDAVYTGRKVNLKFTA